MNILWIEKEIPYDGSQLAPHWILKNFKLVGDACVAFRGPCHVPVEKMVDLIDVALDKPIFSHSMLHFIAEFFNTDLDRAILLQRNLVSLAQQEITLRTKNPSIVRGGNDLYDEGAKISVSIATASPLSTLIHFGINISSEGTPVKTRGLTDYRIEATSFAKSLLATFRFEVTTLAEHRAKVRPVGL